MIRLTVFDLTHSEPNRTGLFIYWLCTDWYVLKLILVLFDNRLIQLLFF